MISAADQAHWARSGSVRAHSRPPSSTASSFQFRSSSALNVSTEHSSSLSAPDLRASDSVPTVDAVSELQCEERVLREPTSSSCSSPCLWLCTSSAIRAAARRVARGVTGSAASPTNRRLHSPWYMSAAPCTSSRIASDSFSMRRSLCRSVCARSLCSLNARTSSRSDKSSSRSRRIAFAVAASSAWEGDRARWGGGRVASAVSVARAPSSSFSVCSQRWRWCILAARSCSSSRRSARSPSSMAKSMCRRTRSSPASRHAAHALANRAISLVDATP
mmetsp:Transcript_998/g.1812  ORF Transcript_998/g.1812 Transcript_998/m.1812 type:complete len:276 (+) Transcript_998:376-1203(+)